MSECSQNEWEIWKPFPFSRCLALEEVANGSNFSRKALEYGQPTRVHATRNVNQHGKRLDHRFNVRLPLPKRQIGITVINMLWFWGLTVGVALGLEFATSTFYFGLLAVGALGGLGASAIGAPVIVQVSVTAAVTLFGIVAIRPLALKRFARVPISARTGVDALIGAEALTLMSVTLHEGQVKLKGETWSARLDPDLAFEPIEPNARVSISRIDGATALIFPLD